MPPPTREGLNEDLTRAFQQSTIFKEVRDLVKLLVNAINTRELQHDNPLFLRSVDPKFCATPAPPVKLTNDQYLAYLTGIVSRNPQYRVTINNIDPYINQASGTVDVLLDFELSGVPIGVVRHSISLMRFRKGKGGQWLFYEYSATDGIMEN